MENDGQIPFFDVNVLRENGNLETNVYRKETSTVVDTNFLFSYHLNTNLAWFIRSYIAVFA